MNTALLTLHWIAGFIVLAEALNKLERTAPCRRGVLGWRRRATEWLKVLAWLLLAMGGAGAVITPLLPLERPTLQDLCIVLGFAVLIVRTRVKEG
jgi:hypothetical protein